MPLLCGRHDVRVDLGQIRLESSLLFQEVRLGLLLEFAPLCLFAGTLLLQLADLAVGFPGRRNGLLDGPHKVRTSTGCSRLSHRLGWVRCVGDGHAVVAWALHWGLWRGRGIRTRPWSPLAVGTTAWPSRWVPSILPLVCLPSALLAHMA